MTLDTLRLTYRAAYAEAVKGILLILGYRFNNVAYLGTFVFVFIGIGYFMGNGRLQAGSMESPLLGYLEQVASRVFFPELWDMRTELAEPGRSG